MTSGRISRGIGGLLGAALVGLSYAPAASADPEDGGWVMDGPNVNPDTWVLNGYMTQAEYNFIKRLRDQGVKTPLPTGATMQLGHLICRNIERGVPLEDGTARYFPTATAPQIVAAAQSEMCPWTLGTPPVSESPAPSGRV